MRSRFGYARVALLMSFVVIVVFGCAEDQPQAPLSGQPGLLGTAGESGAPTGGPLVGPETSEAQRAAAGPEFSSANGAVEQVDPSILTCDGVITFDDVVGGSPPGTNYDTVFESDGADFAERFVGQTRTTVSAGGYDFDALSGTPSSSLALQVGDPGKNINILQTPECGLTQVLNGLGPVGYPSFNAIGEGSFAVLFDFDQSEFGFRICGGDGGSLTIDFFKRDGTLIDQIVLSGLGDQVYAFKRAGGVRDVAGVSIWNTDPAGIGIDDICHDVPGVPGRPVYMDIKPTSCPNPFNVKMIEEPENTKSMKGGILPVALLGTEFLDVQTIDPSSLYLEGVAPVRYGYEDVTTPVTGECECTTLGPDGYMDLTLKFTVREISAVLASASPGDLVELTLTGTLLDGTPFEATDCVRIIGDISLPKR